MRPTSLSVSQLQDYGSCAKRWQLKRALKLPYRRGLSLIFGTALHAGLETFNESLFSRTEGEQKRLSIRNQANDSGGFKKVVSLNPPANSDVDMAHVIQMFEESFDAGLSEAVDEGGDPVKDEYEKIQRQKNASKKLKALSLEAFRVHTVKDSKKCGKELLEQYSARTDHGDRALFIEERGDLEISGLPFRYVADLVDAKDGKVRLIDYKSKAKSDATLASMQLVVYAWILKKEHGLDVAEIYQYNFIKSSTKPRIEVLTYDMKDYESDITIFHQETEMFIKGIESGVFPRNQNPFCAACGVREVCYKPDKEFELLDKLRADQEANLLFNVEE